MNKDDIRYFCQDLNDYLKSRFSYKSDPAYYDDFSYTINSVNRKKFQLYIRWQPNSTIWLADTLVIARIGFYEQNAGHGTDFLKFLLDRAGRYRYEKIVVESARTDSIKSFVQKYGFNGNECDNKDCWGILVDELKKVSNPTLYCTDGNIYIDNLY